MKLSAALPAAALCAALALQALRADGAAARVRPIAASLRSELVTYTALHPLGDYIDSPALFGETVAWTDGAAPANGPFSSAVYIASVHAKHPRLVARATIPTPLLGSLRLSARWISWVAYNSESGEWRLVAQSRLSGARVVVDSSQREGGPIIPEGDYPTIGQLDGNELVWSYSVYHRSGNAYTAVRVRTLPDGPGRVLERESWPGCRVTWPAIGGSMATWDREGPCVGRNSDVIVGDWRTGRSHAVTHDHRSSEPAINGRFLAYKSDALRYGDGSITLVNLRTGARKVVDSSGTALAPVLTTGVLAWYSRGGGNILALALRSRRQYVVAREPPPSSPVGIAYGTRDAGWRNEVVFVKSTFRLTGGRGHSSILVARVPDR